MIKKGGGNNLTNKQKLIGNKFLEYLSKNKEIKESKVIVIVGHGYTIANNNHIENLDTNNNIIVLPTDKSIALPDNYNKTLELINKELTNLINESENNITTMNLSQKIVEKANKFLQDKYNWNKNSNKKYFDENGLLQKYTIFERSPNIFITLKGDNHLLKDKNVDGKIKKILLERNYVCFLTKNSKPIFRLPMENDILSFTLNDFIKNLKLENKIIIPIVCTEIKQKKVKKNRTNKKNNNNWENSPLFTKKSLSRVFKTKKNFNNNILPPFSLNSKKKIIIKK